MNLALVILRSGQSLVAWTEQLEMEPKVHMFRPHLVSGKTKLSLTPWPEHTDDQHILLTSDQLMTVCDPSDKVAKSYEAKVEKPEDPEERPVLLNENDESVNDEYEPRYIEEPLY